STNEHHAHIQSSHRGGLSSLHLAIRVGFRCRKHASRRPHRNSKAFHPPKKHHHHQPPREPPSANARHTPPPTRRSAIAARSTRSNDSPDAPRHRPTELERRAKLGLAFGAFPSSRSRPPVRRRAVGPLPAYGARTPNQARTGLRSGSVLALATPGTTECGRPSSGARGPDAESSSVWPSTRFRPPGSGI